jgi:uncharacterized protein
MSAERPPRYAPHLPLPARPHSPGMRRPAGESRAPARPRAAVEPFDESRWRECERYLHGVDLFNAGFYWEAHEAWEAAWMTCGRRSAEWTFLKGLIKLTAGLWKERSQAGGGSRLLRSACEHFDRVRIETGSAWFAGLELEALASIAGGAPGGAIASPVLLPRDPGAH